MFNHFKLQELQELHEAKLGEEDRWRAYSYIKSEVFLDLIPETHINRHRHSCDPRVPQTHPVLQ